MVSTHIAWGCYPTSVSKGFPSTFTLGRAAYGFTLLAFTDTSFWSRGIGLKSKAYETFFIVSLIADVVAYGGVWTTRGYEIPRYSGRWEQV